MELNQQSISPDLEVNSAASFLEWSDQCIKNLEKIKSENAKQKLQQAKDMAELELQKNYELLIKEYPELEWMKFTVSDNFKVNYDGDNLTPKIAGFPSYKCKINDSFFIVLTKEEDYNGTVFSFCPCIFRKDEKDLPYHKQAIYLQLPRNSKEIKEFYAELAKSRNSINTNIPF